MQRPQQKHWGDASSDDDPDPPPMERSNCSPKVEKEVRAPILKAWRGGAEIKRASHKLAFRKASNMPQHDQLLRPGSAASASTQPAFAARSAKDSHLVVRAGITTMQQYQKLPEKRSQSSGSGRPQSSNTGCPQSDTNAYRPDSAITTSLRPESKARPGSAPSAPSNSEKQQTQCHRGASSRHPSSFALQRGDTNSPMQKTRPLKCRQNLLEQRPSNASKCAFMEGKVMLRVGMMCETATSFSLRHSPPTQSGLVGMLEPGRTVRVEEILEGSGDVRILSGTESGWISPWVNGQLLLRPWKPSRKTVQSNRLPRARGPESSLAPFKAPYSCKSMSSSFEDEHTLQKGLQRLHHFMHTLVKGVHILVRLDDGGLYWGRLALDGESLRLCSHDCGWSETLAFLIPLSAIVICRSPSSFVTLPLNLGFNSKCIVVSVQNGRHAGRYLVLQLETEDDMIYFQDMLNLLCTHGAGCNVAGNLIDDMGEPIVGACIEIAGLTTFTTCGGTFEVRIPQPHVNSLLQICASKTGHAPIRFAVLYTGVAIPRLCLLLQRLDLRIEVPAGTAPVTITDDRSGAVLTIPDCAFKDSDGEPFFGQCEICCSILDLTRQDLIQALPTLSGQAVGGSLVPMQLAAAVYFEARGSCGEQLQLSKPIHVDLPIQTCLEEGSIPSSWYWNKAIGTWLQTDEPLWHNRQLLPPPPESLPSCLVESPPTLVSSSNPNCQCGFEAKRAVLPLVRSKYGLMHADPAQDLFRGIKPAVWADAGQLERLAQRLSGEEKFLVSHRENLILHLLRQYPNMEDANPPVETLRHAMKVHSESPEAAAAMISKDELLKIPTNINRMRRVCEAHDSFTILEVLETMQLHGSNDAAAAEVISNAATKRLHLRKIRQAIATRWGAPCPCPLVDKECELALEKCHSDIEAASVLLLEYVERVICARKETQNQLRSASKCDVAGRRIPHNLVKKELKFERFLLCDGTGGSADVKNAVARLVAAEMPRLQREEVREVLLKILPGAVASDGQVDDALADAKGDIGIAADKLKENTVVQAQAKSMQAADKVRKCLKKEIGPELGPVVAGFATAAEIASALKACGGSPERAASRLAQGELPKRAAASAANPLRLGCWKDLFRLGLASQEAEPNSEVASRKTPIISADIGCCGWWSCAVSSLSSSFIVGRVEHASVLISVVQAEGTCYQDRRTAQGDGSFCLVAKASCCLSILVEHGGGSFFAGPFQTNEQGSTIDVGTIYFPTAPEAAKAVTFQSLQGQSEPMKAAVKIKGAECCTCPTSQ